MDQALGHFIGRFFDPFNAESRFYWPFVGALIVATIANVVWYYTRQRTGVSPAEVNVRPWAVWANLIAVIWAALLVIAKVPFIVIAVSFVLDVAALAYLYVYWLPPRDAAWKRELRRQRFIPQGDGKRRRRRTA